MISQGAMFPMEVEFHSEKCHFCQQKPQKKSGWRPTRKKGNFLILIVFGRGGRRKNER
jgi:hypothetical protein